MRSDRKRLADTNRALSEPCATADYMQSAAELLRALVPGSHAIVHDFADPRTARTIGLGTDSTLCGPLSDVPMRNVADYGVYGRDAPDGLANVVVTLDELAVLHGEPIGRVRRELLAPLGLWHAMRCTLWEADRLEGFCAMARERGAGDFDLRERRLLAAVVPTLRDAMSAMRAIGCSPLSPGTLAQLLDTFHEPAFLGTARGSIVFANRAARRVYPRRPDWLARAVQKPDSAQTRALVRVSRIDVGGKTLFLVLPRASAIPVHGQSVVERLGLPVRLSIVAELLVAGLQDKDVSQRLGLSITTVRTYIARIYRKLGVHSRFELMRLVTEMQGGDPATVQPCAPEAPPGSVEPE